MASYVLVAMTHATGEASVGQRLSQKPQQYVDNYTHNFITNVSLSNLSLLL